MPTIVSKGAKKGTDHAQRGREDSLRFGCQSLCRIKRTFVLTSVVIGTAAIALHGEPLKLNGCTSVSPPVEKAAEFLRTSEHMDIRVDTEGGSAGGISQLGEGKIQIGMSSRPVDEDDLRSYPNVRFVETVIGKDAVALVVSRDIWESGLRSLSKQVIRDMYEGRIQNWKDVGGPNRRIAFYNRDQGRGTWVVFVNWLYGGVGRAPKSPPLLEAGGDKDALSTVAGSLGAITEVSSAQADNQKTPTMAEREQKTFALAIQEEDGTVVEPSLENIRAKRYPMTRKLTLVTNGAPTGDALTFVKYMLSKDGQAIVKASGYLTASE